MLALSKTREQSPEFKSACLLLDKVMTAEAPDMTDLRDVTPGQLVWFKVLVSERFTSLDTPRSSALKTAINFALDNLSLEQPKQISEYINALKAYFERPNFDPQLAKDLASMLPQALRGNMDNLLPGFYNALSEMGLSLSESPRKETLASILFNIFKNEGHTTWLGHKEFYLTRLARKFPNLIPLVESLPVNPRNMGTGQFEEVLANLLSLNATTNPETHALPAFRCLGTLLEKNVPLPSAKQLLIADRVLSGEDPLKIAKRLAAVINDLHESDPEKAKSIYPWFSEILYGTLTWSISNYSPLSEHTRAQPADSDSPEVIGSSLLTLELTRVLIGITDKLNLAADFDIEFFKFEGFSGKFPHATLLALAYGLKTAPSNVTEKDLLDHFAKMPTYSCPIGSPGRSCFIGAEHERMILEWVPPQILLAGLRIIAINTQEAAYQARKRQDGNAAMFPYSYSLPLRLSSVLLAWNKRIPGILTSDTLLKNLSDFPYFGKYTQAMQIEGSLKRALTNEGRALIKLAIELQNPAFAYRIESEILREISTPDSTQTRWEDLVWLDYPTYDLLENLKRIRKTEGR